ncbi:MAG: SEC-C metal-binding domain-containing protein [Pirellulaceae bacterium]
MRKNLLEYDEVMDEQRKKVYSYRQAILEGVNCKELIADMIHSQVEENLSGVLMPNYGTETFAAWASHQLSVTLDAKDFRGTDIQAAERIAKDEAERLAESEILDAIDENLPDGEEESEWNWGALAKFVDTKWGLNIRDRDLKNAGRQMVDQFLIEKVREVVQKQDLSPGEDFLKDDFSIRTVCAWVHHKFGFEMSPSDFDSDEPAKIKETVKQKAFDAYEAKEYEYPVMAGMYRYTSRDSSGAPRFDRQGIVEWARQRFNVELDADAVKAKQREEVRDMLLEHSQACVKTAEAVLTEAKSKVERLFDKCPPQAKAKDVTSNGSLKSLSSWAKETLKAEISEDEIAELDRDSLEDRLSFAVEERYRPEIRRMERSLLLQIVDTAWKDHLLAMDHLRSAVGLVGYAQVDPKVEYKREGRKNFEQMWSSIGQRVTDLIFRMEQLDERFVGSTWVETKASHAEAPSTSEIASEQQQAIENSQSKEEAIETIRNRGERVGRNDPCPCGSGKKYKNCCLKNR